MPRRQGSWNDIRSHGFLIAVSMALFASLVAWGVHTALTAKAPGETNCYKDVCHRVYTLDETRRMIGLAVDLHATHYDDPSVDKMNTGELTSSGEAFDASNPARTSASNYPDGTELLLWNPTTRKASHVRVNDFGPFWGKRTIDVTRRVADDLGFAKAGVAQLRVIVLWVPPAQAARYRKYRTYPMSFGLLGVVEPDQIDALARKLILSSDQRNRELMPRPIDPPDFAAEAAAIAAAEAALLPQRIADLMANLPNMDLGAQPRYLYRQLYAGPPGMRVEATRDVPLATAEATANLTMMLTAADRDRPAIALSDELTPPAPMMVAAAEPIGVATAPEIALPETLRVAPAGPTPANRSREGEDIVASDNVRTPATAGQAPSVAGIGSNTSARPADPPVQVTIALAQRPFAFGQSELSLWIGIAVMLTTLLSVAGLARRKGANVRAATSAVTQPMPEPTPQRADNYAEATLAVARHAAARAEADARELLAREKASRDVASLAEAQAREDLANEFTRREAERETQMRVRLEVAAEAQAAAMRELDAITAARRARAASAATAVIAPPPVIAPPSLQARLEHSQGRPPASAIAAAPVAYVAPPIAAARLEARVEPKPVVVEPPPAVFPGVADPKLAAAILGRPGAGAYWGNTIIAQARLDGTARSGSPLRIDGVVEGAVYAPVILVAEGATVRGVLAADVIVVLGSVSGVLSGRKVTIAKSAEIEGEIHYQSMSIDPQAQCDVGFRRLAKDADPAEVGTAAFDALMTRQSRAA